LPRSAEKENPKAGEANLSLTLDKVQGHAAMIRIELKNSEHGQNTNAEDHRPIL
jgi:hypothetical protein